MRACVRAFALMSMAGIKNGGGCDIIGQDRRGRYAGIGGNGEGKPVFVVDEESIIL